MSAPPPAVPALRPGVPPPGGPGTAPTERPSTGTTARPSTAPTERPSTALLTDQYELTMLRAALADGTASCASVFEVFARRLPAGRRYGVVAGLGRFLDALEDFRFTAPQVEVLLERDIVDEPTAAYLAGFRFSGDVDAYLEGDVYFPHSPVLTVSGTFGECVLLETVALSILNGDSAVASAAARMVTAAAGRPLLEMGSRRTGELSAVAAARAAYLTGFAATSNLQAGFAHGVPTVGTVAHSFVLAHRDERTAFASQVASLGVGTTLLVDTYDTEVGIRTAVEVAGPGLGAVRLDSGDLRAEAVRARALLDRLGATRTQVVVTSDLDEHVIAGLADAPVDAYGVGTRLVTGSGAPTAELVYKLVAVADAPGRDRPLRPVAKRSTSKAGVGGRKTAFRVLDERGTAVAERVLPDDSEVLSPAVAGRPLQVPVVRGGLVVHRPTLEEVRRHHRRAMSELQPEDLLLTPGAPRLTGAPEVHP